MVTLMIIDNKDNDGEDTDDWQWSRSSGRELPTDTVLTRRQIHQTGKQPNWQIHKTGKQPNWQIHQTGKQPNWQTSKLANNHTGKQPNWQTTKPQQ